MNFTIILFLIMLVVIIAMGGVIFIFSKTNKNNKKQIEDLKTRLEAARANVEQLSKYIDKLLNIKADEKTISEKIKEAENDEQVNEIIADIINANNNRVQNHEGS